jgi:hypothetical protein
VSRCAQDSATISVAPSGVIAIPLPNAMSPATSRTPPSGVTRAMMLGWEKSELPPLT